MQDNSKVAAKRRFRVNTYNQTTCGFLPRRGRVVLHMYGPTGGLLAGAGPRNECGFCAYGIIGKALLSLGSAGADRLQGDPPTALLIRDQLETLGVVVVLELVGVVDFQDVRRGVV